MEQSAQNVQQQVELYGEPLGEVVRRVTGALDLTQGGLAQVLGLSAPMLSQLVSAQRVKIGNPAVVSRLRAVSELADAAIADLILPNRVAIELDHIRTATGAYTNQTTSHLRRQPAGAAGAEAPLGAGAATRAEPGPGPGASTRPGAGADAEAGTSAGVGTGARSGAEPGAGPGAGSLGRPGVPFGAPGGLPAESPAPAWQAGPGWEVAPPWHRAPAEHAARMVVREIQDLFRAVASAEEIQRAAAAAAAESPAVAELLLAYGTGRTADALAHYDQHHG
ncbi:helix-turn-helix domain-containing protein [Kribbella sp. NPDC004536]|uniref:helix-turn-helix domain-containing protein n=1 Tax=Kribbella sp. NPDC004536 TaxID=3364106 RepID=UPI003675D593